METTAAQFPRHHNHHHHNHNHNQQLPRVFSGEMIARQQHSDNDRSNDCNLTSLCDHVQLEGFNNGTFSDVVVHAMGSTYHLHRLILSRSSYFRSISAPIRFFGLEKVLQLVILIVNFVIVRVFV